MAWSVESRSFTEWNRRSSLEKRATSTPGSAAGNSSSMRTGDSEGPLATRTMYQQRCAWALLARRRLEPANSAQVRRPRHPHRGPMHNRQVALVTGANKGIGLETARQLARRGMTTLIGARDV